MSYPTPLSPDAWAETKRLKKILLGHPSKHRTHSHLKTQPKSPAQAPKYHKLSAQLATTANVMLAVTQSHASRVLQFLRDGVGIPAHVLVGVETGADHYARGQKGGNVAVLLHATNNNGEELVRILSNLEVLTCAVVKAYVIDKNAPTTLEGSAAQISSLLKAKAIPPSAAIRVQTFPPSLLPTFLPQLETTNTKLNLNPHFVADGLVISLVQIPGLGGYRVSVADAFER